MLRRATILASGEVHLIFKHRGSYTPRATTVHPGFASFCHLRCTTPGWKTSHFDCIPATRFLIKDHRLVPKSCCPVIFQASAAASARHPQKPKHRCPINTICHERSRPDCHCVFQKADDLPPSANEWHQKNSIDHQTVLCYPLRQWSISYPEKQRVVKTGMATHSYRATLSHFFEICSPVYSCGKGVFSMLPSKVPRP